MPPGSGESLLTLSGRISLGKHGGDVLRRPRPGVAQAAKVDAHVRMSRLAGLAVIKGRGDTLLQLGCEPLAYLQLLRPFRRDEAKATIADCDDAR
jgi:hypothetical protein